MDDKVSSLKNSRKKVKSVAQERIGSKSITKDVADKSQEKTLLELKKSSGKAVKVVDRKKNDGDKPKRIIKAAEYATEKSDLGGDHEVIKGINARKGNYRGKMKGKNVAGKVNEKNSLVKRNNLIGGVEVEKGDIENVKTPLRKRKRGADGEIAEAFLLSPEKHSSRLRPRKDVPSFRKIVLCESDFERIVGKRVKVFWSGSKKWFVGRIKSFDDEKKLHRILYEDGDKEDLDLKKERFELEVMLSEAFTLFSKTEPNHEKKEMVSDSGGVSGDTTKEGSLKMHDTEPLKHTKMKQKTASRAEKGCSKQDSGKYIEEEVKKAMDMEVDIHSEKTEALMVGETINLRKHRGFNCGKDRDGSVPLKRHANMKKKTTSKAAKKRASKLQDGKDTEEAKNLATDMEVDVLPETVENQVVIHEIKVEKSVSVNHRRNHNESESLSELSSNKTSEISDETLTTKRGLHPMKNEMGSDDGEVSREPGKVHLLTVGNDELLKTPVKMKKKIASKTAKKRGSKHQGGRDTTEDENAEHLVTNMEVNVLPEMIKEKALGGEINVEGLGLISIGKNHDETESVSKLDDETESVSKLDDETASVSKLASKETEESSNELQKKEKGPDGGEVSIESGNEHLLTVGDFEVSRKQVKMKKQLASKAAKKHSSKQQCGKDTEDDKVEQLATNMEVHVLPEKVEEKALSGEINMEGPGDVSIGKDLDGIESVSKLASEETMDDSNKLLTTRTKTLTTEEKPEILKKQKIRNSEAARDKTKDESREKNILEGEPETKIQDSYPPADKQRENDESQLGLASQQTALGGALSDNHTKKGEDQANVESHENSMKQQVQARATSNVLVI